MVEGHEAAYLDWFLTAGTHRGRGVPGSVREAFVAAYTGRDALARGFGYYRATARNAAAIAAAARLVIPTLALGGDTVGDRLFQQLAPIADQLTGDVIEDSGHLLPLDRPDAVAEHLLVDVPWR